MYVQHLSFFPNAVRTAGSKRLTMSARSARIHPSKFPSLSLTKEEPIMATATAPQDKTRTVKLPQVKAQQPMFIGGKWVDSVSGKTFPTLNPATGESICQVA